MRGNIFTKNICVPLPAASLPKFMGEIGSWEEAFDEMIELLQKGKDGKVSLWHHRRRRRGSKTFGLVDKVSSLERNLLGAFLAYNRVIE